MTSIPDKLREVLTDKEVENIRNRNGWAIGKVVLFEDGETAERFEDAFIELFNNEGRAGNFGGVGVMAVDDDDKYREVKAYATQEAFEGSSQDAGWFVDEYTDPQNPDYGKARP